jgi:hypothetical protein
MARIHGASALTMERGGPMHFGDFGIQGPLGAAFGAVILAFLLQAGRASLRRTARMMASSAAIAVLATMLALILVRHVVISMPTADPAIPMAWYATFGVLADLLTIGAWIVLLLSAVQARQRVHFGLLLVGFVIAQTWPILLTLPSLPFLDVLITWNISNADLAVVPTVLITHVGAALALVGAWTLPPNSTDSTERSAVVGSQSAARYASSVSSLSAVSAASMASGPAGVSESVGAEEALEDLVPPSMAPQTRPLPSSPSGAITPLEL